MDKLRKRSKKIDAENDVIGVRKLDNRLIKKRVRANDKSTKKNVSMLQLKSQIKNVDNRQPSASLDHSQDDCSNSGHEIKHPNVYNLLPKLAQDQITTTKAISSISDPSSLDTQVDKSSNDSETRKSKFENTLKRKTDGEPKSDLLKRRKKFKINCEHVDFVSELGYNKYIQLVLTDIFTFLTDKEIAATYCVSKKWTHVLNQNRYIRRRQRNYVKEQAEIRRRFGLVSIIFDYLTQ